MLGPKPGAIDPGDGEMSPEEEDAYYAGLERVREEKREALKDPGASWSEWFFFDAMKWLLGVGFLIADTWIAAFWLAAGSIHGWAFAALAGSLAVAVYLEVLAWRYFWLRPSDSDGPSGGGFRPSWKALRKVGRWTPEAIAIRSGQRTPLTVDGSPDAHEFL